jgi:hypothetical protein
LACAGTLATRVCTNKPAGVSRRLDQSLRATQMPVPALRSSSPDLYGFVQV